jgi:putative PIG3 family NAD(P)H quinone oxidoreductase
MRAAVITRPGGPEVLEIRDVPDPSIGTEDVRVRVRGAALNRADLLQRRGKYPPPPGVVPDVPGLEFAGEVEAIGDRVRSLRVGDRVMGLLAGGGYAEKVALHERLCLPVPPSLALEDAAAVPEAFLTAYDALFLRGEARPGDVLLLHAAASGVGTAALQMARVVGMKVIGLSRSAEKRKRLETMGVDSVLDPAGPGLVERIARAAGRDGVDLVLDFVGASTFALNLEALAEKGRLVQVGTLSGSTVEADLSVIMRKRLTVVGTVLRSRPVEEKIALVQAFGRQMLPLLAAGRIRPVIDRTFPLAEAASAHALMEENASFGKIVLRVP